MKYAFKAGALLLAILPFAPLAQALNLDLNPSQSPLSNATVTTNGGQSWLNVGAGTLKGTLDGKSFSTYCVELNQPLSWDATHYTLASFSAADSNMLNRLYTVANDKVTNLAAGLAFQLAVWEIVSEAQDSFKVQYGNGSGNFGASSWTSTANNTATQWLNEAKNLDASKVTWNTQRLTNAYKQDFILASTVAAVPEPETYAMMLAAMALMGAIARRRSRKL
ncbi:PEP-CTERM sorting domain-containing protein [Craterilacuibacter sp.]|uniref:PEP-CTERM sorting domain-containing protein n=1 Tax=Craterilacuibacter sp. TaxID=2870909 RepID=UPI003F358E9D